MWDNKLATLVEIICIFINEEIQKVPSENQIIIRLLDYCLFINNWDVCARREATNFEAVYFCRKFDEIWANIAVVQQRATLKRSTKCVDGFFLCTEVL